jgi:D-glycero-D-manno-heptose 1,7-bisphosphate phosphatase
MDLSCAAPGKIPSCVRDVCLPVIRFPDAEGELANMALLEPDGIWCDVRTTDFPSGRSALFLDRDGTLIELVDYLKDPDAVVLIEMAVELIRQAKAAGEAIVLVTNQSGIGRGYYDWAAFEAVQARLYELLAVEGGAIDASYACPHPPPDAGGPANSPYRKPAPGMILRAAKDLGLVLAKSRIVGDTPSDLLAGKVAGLSGGILVSSGYGALADSRQQVAGIRDISFDVRVLEEPNIPEQS